MSVLYSKFALAAGVRNNAAVLSVVSRRQYGIPNALADYPGRGADPFWRPENPGVDARAGRRRPRIQGRDVRFTRAKHDYASRSASRRDDGKTGRREEVARSPQNIGRNRSWAPT